MDYQESKIFKIIKKFDSNHKKTFIVMGIDLV